MGEYLLCEFKPQSHQKKKKKGLVAFPHKLPHIINHSSKEDLQPEELTKAIPTTSQCHLCGRTWILLGSS
jgi:hypothetical protein